MTAIIATARVLGRNLELTETPANLGLSENEKFLLILKKKRESIIEITSGKEMDEKLIDSSIEYTEYVE